VESAAPPGRIDPACEGGPFLPGFPCREGRVLGNEIQFLDPPATSCSALSDDAVDGATAMPAANLGIMQNVQG